MLKKLGDGKLVPVKKLTIRITDTNYQHQCQIQVCVETKIGVFEVYPKDCVGRWFSIGDTLNIIPTEDFKVKTRIKVN